MVSERHSKEILAETEFLFGLRENDPHHPAVSKILRLSKNGILKVRILSSAVIELRAVLYSHGLSPMEVKEVCSLMDLQLSDMDIQTYEPLILSDVVLAERLRMETPKLTFFDSLHAAVAKRLNKPLISDDPIYPEAGVKTLSFKEAQEIG